jgi:hypothetical protein
MSTRAGVRLNLDTFEADILDRSATSEYFSIKDFNPVLTGGKNAISLAGSELLKPGTPISIEVLDVNTNPLYIEVGVGKKNVQFRDGVSVVTAIHVQPDTPTGNGKVYIVGTASDGRSVKWEGDVTIEPRKINKTRVRFYKTPRLTVDPRINESAIFSNSDSVIVSGSLYSIATAPKPQTNFLDFDNLRKQVDYKLVSNLPQFNSKMVGETMEITEIKLADGTQLPVTYSIEVNEVLNDTEISVAKPFLYPDTQATQTVRSFASANYKITYTPILPVSQAVIAGQVFKKSLANITLKNIKTFTGNVYRFKIYRKSFNTAIDSETIADSILNVKEVLVDQETADRQREDLGFFPDQDQINTYWFSNGGGLSLTKDSTNIIDGMNFGANPGSNNNKSTYVIAKDDTDRPASGNANYISAVDSQIEVRSGSSWDSNFITLFSDVEYIIKGRIYDERSTPEASSLELYLTGSQLDYDVSNKFDGYGINIGSISFDVGVTNTFKDFEFSLTPTKDVNCAFILVPHDGHFTVSNISIKPFQAFSFSPDVLDITIPFDISVANERFLITAELFDIDHNSVATTLDDIQFFDPAGQTISSSAGIGGSTDWASIIGKPSWVSNFPNVVPLAITASGYSGPVAYADAAGTATSSSYATTATSSSYATTATTATSSSYATTSSLSIVSERSRAGSTRPTSVQAGSMFFDTSLGVPIWYDGSNWINATGSIV